MCFAVGKEGGGGKGQRRHKVKGKNANESAIISYILPLRCCGIFHHKSRSWGRGEAGFKCAVIQVHSFITVLNISSLFTFWDIYTLQIKNYTAVFHFKVHSSSLTKMSFNSWKLKPLPWKMMLVFKVLLMSNFVLLLLLHTTHSYRKYFHLQKAHWKNNNSWLCPCNNCFVFL